MLRERTWLYELQKHLVRLGTGTLCVVNVWLNEGFVIRVRISDVAKNSTALDHFSTVAPINAE